MQWSAQPQVKLQFADSTSLTAEFGVEYYFQKEV